MLYVPDMSRRARAVELWATLKYLGRSGVEELVDGLCDRALQFAKGLQAAGFHILNDVVFNQVLVAGETPAQTRAILDHIQRSGECWCGGTTWNNAPAIRLSVCSWATTPDDVEQAIKIFIKAQKSTGL